MSTKKFTEAADKEEGKIQGANVYDIKRTTWSEFRVPPSYMWQCGLSETPESADGTYWVRRKTISEFRAPADYMNK